MYGRHLLPSTEGVALYIGIKHAYTPLPRLHPPPHMPFPLRLPCVPSVAVSDAILAAQSAFAGGEFQPEEFPRAACLLVEAFEGGDNAIRLCTARLLERFRPYLGSNILTVEVCKEYDSAVSSPFYDRLFYASSERVRCGGKVRCLQTVSATFGHDVSNHARLNVALLLRGVLLSRGEYSYPITTRGKSLTCQRDLTGCAACFATPWP